LTSSGDSAGVTHISKKGRASLGVTCPFTYAQPFHNSMTASRQSPNRRTASFKSLETAIAGFKFQTKVAGNATPRTASDQAIPDQPLREMKMNKLCGLNEKVKEAEKAKRGKTGNLPYYIQ